jgi:MFS family permease
LRNVWLLTFVVVLFSLTSGIMWVAVPQACLGHGFSDQALGLVGAGGPGGYLLGCLACGRFLRRIRGKFILLLGVLGSILAMLGMAWAPTPAAAVTAQVGYGLSNAAFFPVVIAWMLDFQNAGLSKARILRHYNLAWTSGTALAMYATGLACKQGWVFECFCAGAGVSLAALALALVPEATRHGEPETAGKWGQTPFRPSERVSVPIFPRLPLAILLAAVLGNVMALGTRSVLLVNYAKLNQQLGFEADRMGSIAAGMIVGQLAAFALGAVYERWLGLRRVYLFLAAGLAGVQLTFAFCTSLPVLVLTSLLDGLLLALAFQASLMAATAHFHPPRRGTTFHEAIVGLSGLMPLPMGWLIETARARGCGELTALRLPLWLLTGLVLASLLVQCLLVARHARERTLAPETPGPAGGDEAPRDES